MFTQVYPLIAHFWKDYYAKDGGSKAVRILCSFYHNYMLCKITGILLARCHAINPYRYMYLKKAWYLKTYIDTNSSIDFEKLH